MRFNLVEDSGAGDVPSPYAVFLLLRMPGRLLESAAAGCGLR